MCPELPNLHVVLGVRFSLPETEKEREGKVKEGRSKKESNRERKEYEEMWT